MHSAFLQASRTLIVPTWFVSQQLKGSSWPQATRETAARWTTASFPSTASLTVWYSLMSPRIFSQSRKLVFALNFRSRSETESPLAWSFSARWLPMNPFPPVIRNFEISYSPIGNLLYRRDPGTRRLRAIQRWTGSSSIFAKMTPWVFQYDDCICLTV